MSDFCYFDTVQGQCLVLTILARSTEAKLSLPWTQNVKVGENSYLVIVPVAGIKCPHKSNIKRERVDRAQARDLCRGHSWFVRHLMWVLETKLRVSARAASAFNHRGLSSLQLLRLSGRFWDLSILYVLIMYSFFITRKYAVKMYTVCLAISLLITLSSSYLGYHPKPSKSC